jgi:hypothetical protein
VSKFNTLFASHLHTLGATIVSAAGILPDGRWISGEANSTLGSPLNGNTEVTVPFLAQYCDDNISGPCGLPNPSPGGYPPSGAAVQGVSNSPAVSPGKVAPATVWQC